MIYFLVWKNIINNEIQYIFILLLLLLQIKNKYDIIYLIWYAILRYHLRLCNIQRLLHQDLVNLDFDDNKIKFRSNSYI